MLSDTCDLRQSALGFLDLPPGESALCFACTRPLIVRPEIRLQIYGYLLLTVQSVSLASKTPYSRLSPILIIEHRNKRPGGIKPSTVAVPWSSWQAVPFRTYSAILSTCKAVHDEAISLLYEKNVFNFYLPNEAKDEAAIAPSLSEQCDNVFKYEDNSWQQEGPLLLKDSTFACFLHRIGPRNAASLKAIIFHAKDGDIGRYQFSVVGSLLERHVPNVKFVRFNVTQMRIYVPRINSTRVDTEEELKRLLRVLTDLVRGCSSLEEFDFVGEGFPYDIWLPNGDRKFVSFREKSQHPYLREIVRMLKERKERKKAHLRMARENEKVEREGLLLQFFQRDEVSTHKHQRSKMRVGATTAGS